MTSDEQRRRQQYCAAALQQQQLHTPNPWTSWTRRRDLEKIARAPQVVDGGGGGGSADVDQRILRSMRGTALYYKNI